MDEDEAIRAHFPLSFGKKTKASHQPHAATAHTSTRRVTLSTASVRNTGNTNPVEELRSSAVDEEGMIGPPRPPPPPPPELGEEDGDDGVTVGPPRPPVVVDDDDDRVMIGPPRPPLASEGLDSDDDDDDDLDDGFRGEDSFQIPLTNEVVLKGHSKVRAFVSTLVNWNMTLSLSLQYEVLSLLGIVPNSHSVWYDLIY